MSTGAIISLALQGAVALIWIILAVSIVSSLRSSGAGFGTWLRAPENKQMRNTFGFITLCLILMVGQSALLG